MEEILGIVVYVIFIVGILGFAKKKGIKTTSKGVTFGNQNNQAGPAKTYQPSQPFQQKSYTNQQSSAMPHTHRKEGHYDTFNKKSIFNESGTMPHKHETGHYTSMSDASKLPPGYILLNGEPVRVADLEGK